LLILGLLIGIINLNKIGIESGIGIEIGLFKMGFAYGWEGKVIIIIGILNVRQL
jgi:hypothetical protein